MVVVHTHLRARPPKTRSWLYGGIAACLASFSPVMLFAEVPGLPPVPALVAVESIKEGVTQVTALQPVPPAGTPPTPDAAKPGPTILEPTEVIAEQPTQPNFNPQLPAPTSPFADTIFDSPFYTPPTRGYGAADTSSATRLNIPIMDFPGVINVVTEDLLKDRQSITLDQALRTVPNVQTRNGAGNRTDEYYIRGFNVGFGTSDFRKDGFRDTNLGFRELQNIERVEVLKGPASIIYGSASQPAGTINLVTKKPLQESFADFDAMIGSYELYRETADVNSPLFGSNDILSRTNIAIQNSDSFRDFVFLDRQFISQAFTFVLDDATTLTFMGEYLHNNNITDRGIVAFPGNVTGSPFNVRNTNFYGEPSDRNNDDDGQFNLVLNRELNNIWNLRLGWVSNWSGEHRDNFDTNSVVNPTNPVTAAVRRQYVRQDSIADDQYFQGDLVGDFDTGFINHKLLLGTEMGASRTHQTTNQNTNGGAFYSINLLNPVHNTPIPGMGTINAGSGSAVNQYSGFVQDMIEMTPYLKALVGVRYSHYDQTTVSYNNNFVAPLDRSFDAWTPRYGIVLEPIPEDLSYYVGYSQSFNPVNNTLPLLNGSPAEPEAGWGFDVGTKMRLRDQLWLTVGYFDLERTNVIQNLLAPNNLFLTQLGKVRSTGMEAELYGQLTDRWSIQSGFGLTDARVVADVTPANVKQQLINAPYWSGSLWTRYNLIQNNDRVFGLAYGMYYTDSWRTATGANTFYLPAYTRHDLGAFFDVGRLRTSLFVENFTDIEYFSGGNGFTSNAPGAPVSVRGTVGITF